MAAEKIFQVENSMAIPQHIKIPRLSYNPIQYAALFGHVMTLELLLSHGSLYKQSLNTDLEGFIGGENPLQAAAFSGNPLGVWAVLNNCKSIDVNSKDKDNKTGNKLSSSFMLIFSQHYFMLPIEDISIVQLH